MWIIPKTYPLQFLFAQDMLDSKEDLILQAARIESSLMWRSKHGVVPQTAAKSWSVLSRELNMI